MPRGPSWCDMVEDDETRLQHETAEREAALEVAEKERLLKEAKEMEKEHQLGLAHREREWKWDEENSQLTKQLAADIQHKKQEHEEDDAEITRMWEQLEQDAHGNLEEETREQNVLPDPVLKQAMNKLPAISRLSTG